MNKLRQRPWLAALAVVAAMAALTVLSLAFQDFVREAIVVPLSYTLAGARSVIGRLPQTLLWILFVGLALLLSLTTLLVTAQVRRRGRPLRREHRGRVENWLRWIRLADDAGQYSLQYLTLRLRELALDVLAENQLLTREEAEQQLVSLKLDVPPHIRPQLEALLAANSSRAVLGETGPADNENDSKDAWRGNPAGSDKDSKEAWRGNGKRAGSVPGFDMTQIVQFLEEQLEVPGE